MTSSMISAVPPELSERTLSLCHPRDVASFAQTCRGAYALVYQSSDQYLWRTLFLDYPFDDPRLSTSSSSISKVDWRAKLQRRVRAEHIARSDGDRCEFVEVLLECVHEAAPRAARESSHNISWITTILTLEESPWIERFLRLGPFDSPSIKYFASDAEELRAHLALSLDHGVGTEAPEKLRVLRRMSRAYVYDLRNYTRAGNWGPFIGAGDSINWRHVNAIVTVITMNLRDFGIHWPKEFKPQAIVRGLEACRAYSASGSFKRSSLDWAGVEGEWMRITCGWNPGFFDDGYQEASRLLLLNLRVISVENDPEVLEKLPDPSRPPITFGGTMRGFNSDSDEILNRVVRGTVRLMKDGNIRWSFFRGVQIGGVCSSAGVVGAWSGAHHGQGPFWLFKAEENTPKEGRRR
ncbi:hypothetical protein B0F90DRAFT_1807020 [Multifurca ochricompacta]|uniref:F-box domain-containing protein n=1 Tax=Multifurca ochricompacta TaxID=376703 RepID=A0AAD4MEH2_9AGAM|nr:hypothetical protein B0F90DRAFT_1807020 [Multifurca ochricompacta]